MSSSKLTSKFQTMIPKEIIKALPIDKEYLKAIQNTFTEWNSEEDENAFKHLQDI